MHTEIAPWTGGFLIDHGLLNPYPLDRKGAVSYPVCIIVSLSKPTWYSVLKSVKIKSFFFISHVERHTVCRFERNMLKTQRKCTNQKNLWCDIENGIYFTCET